jgi:hypothetical protein
MKEKVLDMVKINSVPTQFSKNQKYLLALISAVNKRKDWDKTTKRIKISEIASLWKKNSGIDNIDDELEPADNNEELPDISEDEDLDGSENSTEVTDNEDTEVEQYAEVEELDDSDDSTEIADDETEDEDDLSEELIAIWEDVSSQDDTEEINNRETPQFPITITTERDFRKLYKDSDQNDGSEFDEWIQGWVVPQLEQLLINSSSYFLDVLETDEEVDDWIKSMGINEKTSTNSVNTIISKQSEGLNIKSLSKILGSALIAKVIEELEYSEVAALDLLTASIDDSNEIEPPEWLGEKGISELFNDLRRQNDEEAKGRVSYMCKLSVMSKIRTFIEMCYNANIEPEPTFEAINHAVMYLLNEGLIEREHADFLLEFATGIIDETLAPSDS